MLYIDANIYLELFKSSQASLKKLLPPIKALKDEIFITSQVVSEVNRNKVKIASEGLHDYVKNYKPPGAILPELLDEEGESKVKNWNKELVELRAGIKKTQNDLSDVVDHLLRKVMNGEDGASLSLRELFAKAKTPTDAELHNARIRKELGNPPGKPSDPLGDQLSWEQLLSAYDGKTPLWIISVDTDYSSQVNSARYLNAFLFEEVKGKIGRKPEVYVFDSLARGIEHYSEKRAIPIERMPSKDQLREMAAKKLRDRNRSGLPRGFFIPNSCYRCGAVESFSGPVPKPSHYGGWTYQWLCNACHQWNDFGEPYDMSNNWQKCMPTGIHHRLVFMSQRTASRRALFLYVYHSIETVG